MRIRLPVSLGAVCALAICGAASAQQPVGTTAHSASQDRESFNLSEYWTREMRAGAEPLEWNDADAQPDLNLEAEDAGPEGATESGAPSPRALLRAQRDFPEEWPDDGDAEEFVTPEPEADAADAADLDDFSAAAREAFDAYPLRNPFYPARYPWRTIGKLFFDTVRGGSSCSASVVSRNNIVVTAAHCCYDRSARRFNTNFAFVPATQNDSAPFGVFPYDRARVLNAWISRGGRHNDVCVVRLRRNSIGLPVTFYTGWLGRSWNFPPSQHHFTVGYPGNLDQGKIQQVCAAESFALGNCGGSAVLHTGCDQTFGSSGGPWIRVYKPEQIGAMNFVNSVVSGHDACSGRFGRVYNGARFTTGNIVPLCRDEGC